MARIDSLNKYADQFEVHQQEILSVLVNLDLVNEYETIEANEMELTWGNVQLVANSFKACRSLSKDPCEICKTEFRPLHYQRSNYRNLTLMWSSGVFFVICSFHWYMKVMHLRCRAVSLSYFLFVGSTTNYCKVTPVDFGKLKLHTLKNVQYNNQQ